MDEMGFNGGLAAALMGDEAFFEAIERAAPNTWGGFCECDCYFVGHFDEIDPKDAACPVCSSTHFGLESPALGSGQKAVRRGS